MRVPTVTVNGIQMIVHPDDHHPAHVHCRLAGAEVVVLLVPGVAVRANRGMQAPDVRRVLAAVRANRGRLLAVWRTYHGN